MTIRSTPEGSQHLLTTLTITPIFPESSRDLAILRLVGMVAPLETCLEAPGHLDIPGVCLRSGEYNLTSVRTVLSRRVIRLYVMCSIASRLYLNEFWYCTNF